MASGSGNILPMEIFQLLESSDTAQNIREAILEDLLSSKETWLINLLVDYYFQTESANVKEIISELRESHTKVLIDKLQDGVKLQETRLPALQLVLYLVYKELPWCHQLMGTSFFSSILKCLKTEHDVPVLMTSLMIVVILLPSAPVCMGRYLPQIFDVFGRLTLLCVRKPANAPEMFLLHLQVGLYSLFHRLYGMYPQSLLEFVRKFFSLKENLMAYEEVVMPMLERVRLHPNIIMSQGQNEMDANRWKNQETQDIIVNCSKLSLDLIEGCLEESQCPIYQSLHEVITTSKVAEDYMVDCCPRRGSQSIPVPVAPGGGGVQSSSDSHLLGTWTEAMVVVGESPSVLIGLSTPPSSHRTTPAASFMEPVNLNGSTDTPDTSSRQATPCCGGGGGVEESDRTPLSSNHGSVGQKLSDSGKRPSSSTPKVVPMTTTSAALNTTPVNIGGPFASPVTPHSLTEASPFKSHSSAFVSPKASCSPAMRSIQFAGGGEPRGGDSPKTHHDKAEIQPTNIGKQLNAYDQEGGGDHRKGFTLAGDPDDQEVEEINEREDQFDTGGSPTSSISTQTSQTEITAESVRQFMKKVNRIRFNSLTSNSSSEHDPHTSVMAGIRRRHRPQSCPPFKRFGLRLAAEGKQTQSPKDVGGKHHQQRSGRERSRRSWVKAKRFEEKGVAVEEAGYGDGPEEASEESSEEISSGSGTASIPKITISKSTASQGRRRCSTHSVATQIDPPFPSDINPAFQMLFAPSKIAVCTKCQHDLVLVSSHSAASSTTTTTIASTTGTKDSGKDTDTSSTTTDTTSTSKVTTIKAAEVCLFSAISPPELLDRHLKLGSDLHAKELTKIPLPSKDSVNWTHFGGVPPADEVNILKGQILLMQAQLMYERHKRSNHAKRNRRLLRRIAHEAKLEEQQKSLTDQIRLLEQEVQQLSVSIKLVQEDNGRLRLGHESDQYSKLVQYRSSLQENKDLKVSNVELKNLLLTQKEDYDKLQKKLENVQHVNLEYERDLQSCREQLANTEKLKGQVFKLQKELLLMQELHQKYQEKLHHYLPSHQHKNEQALLVASVQAQLEEVQGELRKKSTLLEAYQASADDHDNLRKKKDCDIAKLKRDLGKTKSEQAEQIKCLEDRISSLIHTNQQLESRVVELMCRVDQRAHKEMMAGLKANEERGKPLSGCGQQSLENPARLDSHQKLESPSLVMTSSTLREAGGHMAKMAPAGGVSVVLAKEEVSAEGSKFFQTGGGSGSHDGFPGRNVAAMSVRSRAETDTFSDSGAASRSSFRVDSDVSMRSVSQDSLMTSDSGCWPKT